MKPDQLSFEHSAELLLISSFNVRNLEALLSKDESSPRLKVRSAPFGMVMQTLLNAHSEVWNEGISSVVVWTSPETVSIKYARLLAGDDIDPESILQEVDAFAAALKKIPERVKCVFVPTWTSRPLEVKLGLLDMDLRRGPSLALARMNLRLAECLRDDRRIFQLDASRWISVHGEKSFSSQLWYASKTPFSVELFKVAVHELKAALKSFAGQNRKLLIVDLDDTLWGGILGDVGYENIRLGGHDPIGEAFKDFQLGLKALKQRGVLLGIASKNNENTAITAISSHPEMALRPDDFAGWRINWEDKAQNMAELTSELNLGLQSVVFIDDNPTERARVREALPEVFVPEWPTNPLDYKIALNNLRCFDSVSIGNEDRVRTEMYVTERTRRQIRDQVGSLEAWLESLQIQITAAPLCEATLERATQLLNKTNQMNLSTRRLTSEELWRWSKEPQNAVWVFCVSDKFGDYGLVGIGSYSCSRVEHRTADLVDFILSCRVMGRKVEETMMHVLVNEVRAAEAEWLQARYLPTPKNQPCLAFFEACGMSNRVGRDSAAVFVWNVQQDYMKPVCVNLKSDYGVCTASATCSQGSGSSHYA
jgi:FkbH-like protein